MDSPVKKELRRRAESLLQDLQGEGPGGVAGEEIRSLVHELQVHQVELEIQNEELRHAQYELAELCDRYGELYDRAPVGYVTLDSRGTILQANLRIAEMLGVERQQLAGAPFPDFVDPEGQDAWHLYRQALFSEEPTRSCELPLRTSQGALLWAHLESDASQGTNRQERQCRTTLLDVTQRNHAERELLQLKNELEQRVADRTGLLAMLCDLATMANRSAIVEEAIRYCLKRVCSHNGWQFGHAWLPAGDAPDVVIAAYLWQETTSAAQRRTSIRSTRSPIVNSRSSV